MQSQQQAQGRKILRKYTYMHIMQIYFTLTYNVIRMLNNVNACLKKATTRWFHVKVANNLRHLLRFHWNNNL